MFPRKKHDYGWGTWGEAGPNLHCWPRAARAEASFLVELRIREGGPTRKKPVVLGWNRGTSVRRLFNKFPDGNTFSKTTGLNELFEATLLDRDRVGARTRDSYSFIIY